MTTRARLTVILCACSFSVGIHGKRCAACQEQMCMVCTRASEIRAGLCARCDAEYDADMVERAQERDDAKHAIEKEPSL